MLYHTNIILYFFFILLLPKYLYDIYFYVICINYILFTVPTNYNKCIIFLIQFNLYLILNMIRTLTNKIIKRVKGLLNENLLSRLLFILFFRFNKLPKKRVSFIFN